MNQFQFVFFLWMWSCALNGQNRFLPDLIITAKTPSVSVLEPALFSLTITNADTIAHCFVAANNEAFLQFRFSEKDTWAYLPTTQLVLHDLVPTYDSVLPYQQKVLPLDGTFCEYVHHANLAGPELVAVQVRAGLHTCEQQYGSLPFVAYSNTVSIKIRPYTSVVDREALQFVVEQDLICMLPAASGLLPRRFFLPYTALIQQYPRTIFADLARLQLVRMKRGSSLRYDELPDAEIDAYLRQLRASPLPFIQQELKAIARLEAGAMKEQH